MLYLYLSFENAGILKRWAGNHLYLLLKEQVAMVGESLKLVVFKDNPLVVALTFSSGKTFTAKTVCQSTLLSV